jgi:thiamine biosynthesis protein ThiS
LRFGVARAISPAMIQIELNGETREISPGSTVTGLLAELGLDTRKVAVERNLEIVPKSRYGETALNAGDRIEIVHFVGGG